MKQLIIVAGMHRSGTSMLAGSLAACGINFGDNLIPPDKDNPKGYWENKKVVSIHNKLLDRFESSWSDTRKLPENWHATAWAKEAEEDLSD